MISKVSKFTRLLNRGKLGLQLVCYESGSLFATSGMLGQTEASRVKDASLGHEALRRQHLVGLPGVSTINPAGCGSLTWSFRQGWGEAAPPLPGFSAEWLGETCRSHPAGS